MGKKLVKKLIIDLSKNKFTDVTLKLIDNNKNEMLLNFHKFILAFHSEFFKNAFHFKDQDNFTFNNLDSIEITKMAILSLYEIEPNISDSLSALQLVKTCNYFSIPLNFEWINKIDYRNNISIEHLQEILYYIENTNFLFSYPSKHITINHINKEITKLKSKCLLLPNMFFIYHDYKFKNNYVNENNIVVTDNDFSLINRNKICIESVEDKLIVIDNTSVYELFLYERNMEKLFGVPDNKFWDNYIIYNSKICYLIENKLLIYDLEVNSKFIEIEFDLPEEKDMKSIPKEYFSNRFCLKGIIGNFEKIVICAFSRTYNYPTNLFICSRKTNENRKRQIKNIIYEQMISLPLHNFIDLIHFSRDNTSNFKNLSSKILIDDLAAYSNIFFWNNIQKCGIHISLKISEYLNNKFSLNFEMRIINQNNDILHTTDIGDIVHTGGLIIRNSKKYPLIAYMDNNYYIDNCNMIGIYLFNLETFEKKFILSFENNKYKKNLYFSNDGDHLHIIINDDMFLYSLKHDNFVFQNVKFDNIKNYYFIKLINEENK